MRPRTASRGVAVLTLAAAIAAGCGGDDDKPPPDLPPAPRTPTVKPTATDLKIVRLVQRTGGRLHLDAIRLFGDRGVLDDKGALKSVAADRMKVARQLKREASAASTKLESLGQNASAATQVTASGKTAFDELASCGHDAAAFFRSAQAGRSGAPGGPEAACKSARLAYGQAKTLSDALEPAPAEGATTAGS